MTEQTSPTTIHSDQDIDEAQWREWLCLNGLRSPVVKVIFSKALGFVVGDPQRGQEVGKLLKTFLKKDA